MLFFKIITSETSEMKDIRSRTPDKELDDLLMRIAAGDKAALEAFYHRTKAAVYGLALSILKNRPDAEDVLQDTYVKIYTSAKSYHSQGKPMAWILTIVRNLSLMRFRESKKNEEFPDEPQRIPDAHDPVGDRLNHLVLEAAMTVLTDEERQIVIQHGIIGQKHGEIAEFMKLPLSTVLSKYRRALSKLKNQLGGELHD